MPLKSKHANVVASTKTASPDNERAEAVATRTLTSSPGEVAQPSVSNDAPDDDREHLPTLHVEVAYGSLSQADAPVAVVARYQRLPLAGPAREFDYLLRYWLSRAVELGMIGSGLGEVFQVPLAHRKETGEVNAEELLLVGMGEPGRFNADAFRFLVTNVTIAVKAMRKSRLSTNLIGSRRGELTVDAAARAFIQGFLDGYERCMGILQHLGSERKLFLESFDGDLTIVLVERDDARAKEVLRAFKELCQERGIRNKLALTVADAGKIPILRIKEDDEASDTPPPEDRSTLLRVTCPSVQSGVESDTDLAVFQYSALSQSATVSVREAKVNPYFARRLPDRLREARCATDAARFGRLWANYLIPDEFHGVIESSSHLTLVLDETTACFPWEMVALRGRKDSRFLGPDFELSRLFRTLMSEAPGVAPPLNDELRVLVIADPCSGKLALPCARKEGLAVTEAIRHANDMWRGKANYKFSVTLRLGSHQEQEDPEIALANARKGRKDRDVVESAGPCEPLELLSLILDGNYDVIHYAGHGVFDPKGGRMGWVFEGDCVLSAAEIFRVRRVPRLVFANACFSAATGEVNPHSQRVGLAQAFFARGIQNYIGTGWEVQDQAALDVASWFYRQMLGIVSVEGKEEMYDTAPPATIGRALAAARRAVMDRPSTTWGAYQHYGTANAKLLPFRNRHRRATPVES